MTPQQEALRELDLSHELDSLRDLRARVLNLGELAPWTRDAGDNGDREFNLTPAFDVHGCGPLFVPGPESFSALVALARRSEKFFRRVLP